MDYSTAYHQGYQAYSTYPATCPYKDDTSEAQEWRKGFVAAEAESLRDMNAQ